MKRTVSLFEAWGPARGLNMNEEKVVMLMFAVPEAVKFQSKLVRVWMTQLGTDSIVASLLKNS